MRRAFLRLVRSLPVLLVTAVLSSLVFAQQPASTAAATASTTAAAPEKPLFKPEELEQIVAPIALYPDSLLAQIFMASTYPLAIVEAARWQKQHPDVKGDAVAKAVESEDWDPSVKALVAFPQVLTMMDEKVDWTQKLGDAFLAQQKDVMDAVQRLRAKAQKEGNLKSSKEQTVKTEAAPAGSANPQIIIIESADPEVVYVPTYNPTVVYGAWPYPYYPPYYYYPPGYYAGAAFFSFSMGVIVGGALWGNCNWGSSDIDIDINRENNFNRNEINNRPGNTDRAGNRAGDNSRAGNKAGNKAGNSKWQHNAANRKGVEYRDANSRQKYGGASSREAVQSREAFRGRAEQGRQQISREGAGNLRDTQGNRVNSGARDAAGNRDLGGQNRDLGGQSRDRAGQSRDMGGQSRDFGSQNRGSSSRSRGSDTFGGVGNGAGTRASSSRGAASRGGGGMSRGGGGRRR
ncbi:MAG TPA: DUF3300 domain-containing protein [Steroidobacteraceae bacterium]|nr:DUF3300 domain-containing protein [Steroidobacteraceae bacterium]